MNYDSFKTEEPEELEYECTECGAPMEKDKGVCSDACYKASQL